MRKLYCNGDFIPMTGEEDTFEALVVEDGVIAFTGDLADAEEMFPDAEKIDVDGAAVMPGFVDGHSHFLGGYQMVTQADLGACRSFSQIQDTLRTFMEQNQIGPDGVLLGTNYDQNELEEGHHPDKFVLDQVSTEVPIYISHVSSHMGAANSKALEVCGITSETPDPEGGRFGRVEGTAEPNGFIEEVSAVMQMTVPLVGRMKVDQREVYRKVQDIYLSHGITTCQDGASVGVLLANVMPLVEEGLFDLDIVGYPMLGMDKDEVCERYGSASRTLRATKARVGARIRP